MIHTLVRDEVGREAAACPGWDGLGPHQAARERCVLTAGADDSLGWLAENAQRCRVQTEKDVGDPGSDCITRLDDQRLDHAADRHRV
jgi:hypothetical protein